MPEFAKATLGTLNTYDRLEKQRGHIYNWYDIETLRPIAPLTVSAVDSGNLTASLYTLHTGALDLLKRPILDADIIRRPRADADRAPRSATDANTAQSTQDSSAASMRAHVRSLLQQTAVA